MLLKVKKNTSHCDWCKTVKTVVRLNHMSFHAILFSIITFTLLNSFLPPPQQNSDKTEYDKRKVVVSNSHFVTMLNTKTTGESTVLHFYSPLLPQYFTPIVDFLFCCTKQEKSWIDYFCVIYTFALKETQLLFLSMYPLWMHCIIIIFYMGDSINNSLLPKL